MYSKILGLIILITIVFFSAFKENLNNESNKNSKKTDQCSKLNYKEIGYIESQNFSDFSFEIYFKDKKKWKKSRLEDHLKSHENELLSSDGVRFFNKSKD